MDGFIYLLLLCTAIWFWLDSRRAHEFALEICRHVCLQHQALLLDETVSLKTLRIRRGTNGRLQFERRYQFEYCYNEAQRFSGDILILGLTPQEINFDGQRTLL